MLRGGEGADNIDGGNDSDTLWGDSGNDILRGGNGDDWLLGGEGADNMDGGDGNDSYVVDNIGDIVAEVYNDSLGGIDDVQSSVSYTLGYGLEDLELIGFSNIDGFGNGNNNVIFGILAIILWMEELALIHYGVVQVMMHYGELTGR